MKPQPQPPALRILIASTPKTGNTWLKLLLSEIYDLPMVELPLAFDEARLEFPYERWIGHQHYYPVPKLAAWARENHVCLLTTVRHPADTLASLIHYIRKQIPTPPHLVKTASLLALDGEGFGPQAVSFVKSEFFLSLDISVYWMLSSASLVIRYEDLWSDPMGTLSALTSQIHPVSIDRIKRAVARCDFDNLRKSDPEARFFRSGRMGEGRSLPLAILDILHSNEPYVSQFEILGYSDDPTHGSPSSTMRTRPTTNPFRGSKEFDNGVPIPNIATDLFASVENCFERWPRPLSSEGADTFLAWVNAPAETDPSRGSRRLITNLAAYMYRIRRDVQLAYPEPFGKDREAFADWFVSHGAQEHTLPDAFVEPVRSARSSKKRGRRKLPIT